MGSSQRLRQRLEGARTSSGDRRAVRKRNIVEKLALAFLVGILGGCAEAGTPAVVTVGRSAISKGQLAHWTAVLAATDARVGRLQRNHEVLAFLIEARWIEGWARAAGAIGAESEATRRLSLFEYTRQRELPTLPFESQRQLMPYLTSSKATAADRLWLMTLSALREKLHRRQLSRAEALVTGAQVEAYYRRHPSRFFVPEKRDIAIVESYSRPGMIRARQQLRAGANPEVVARRLSIDPVYPHGLQFGYERGEGAPALSKAIFAARPGVVVGPLQVTMYYVFKVLAVKPRHRLPLAAVSARIRRELAVRGPLEALSRDFEREWTARTDCRPGSVVAGCRQYRAPGAE